MTLTWTKENSPRWDEDKQRIFAPEELAATGLPQPRPGEPVADEWWRVTDGGEVAGYGWLDSEWGDARITFVVAPAGRGRGTGAFILEHLEDEAAARGVPVTLHVEGERPTLPIGIDLGDKLSQRHALEACDFLHRVPKWIFKAHAGRGPCRLRMGVRDISRAQTRSTKWRVYSRPQASFRKLEKGGATLPLQMVDRVLLFEPR